MIAAHLWFALFAAPAFATNAEVSPGDDIATITAALTPGSEIVFNDGVYTVASTLTWSAAGTESEPIVLRAKEGATPILELTSGWTIASVTASSYLTIQGLQLRGGEGWEDGGYRGLQIDGSNHVTVVDCDISNTAGTALYLSGNNQDMVLRSNHLHDGNSNGLFVGCNDATCWTESSVIEGNWIHNVGGDSGYGLYLAPGAQGNTVVDNVIYDTGYRGMLVHSTEGGDANTVEGNVIWNANDIGLYVAGASIVRNNVIFNITGVGLYTGDNGRGTFDDVVLSFNTVANTTSYAARIYDWEGRTGMVLANNAFANPTGYGLYFEKPSDTGSVSDALIVGNVVSGLVDGLDADSGAFTGGAGFDDFLDPEGWDFYPSPNSHLINAADPSGDTYVPAADFNGADRPGDAPDVGAYEWTGAENPGWAIQEDFKEVGVDPGADGREVGGGCCGGKSKGAEEGLLLLPVLGLGAARRRRRTAGRP